MAKLRDSTKLSISEQELRDVLNRLDRVLVKTNNTDKKLAILRNQAKKVVTAARAIAPVSKKRHFVYNTVKLLSNRRAKRGYGQKKAVIYPGNLKFSIQTLSLKRARKVYIGPRILRRIKTGGVYGPRNTNAYYAQMIYGSARAFRDRIMIPALVSSRSAIIAGLRRSIKIRIRRIATEEKLRA